MAERVTQLPMASAPLDPLLVEGGRTDCVLGNEAIVRGALEAGVAFACGYPGTPSSEVTDSFARLSAAHGVIFEYSVNEKIALEMAFAASLAGARSIVAMKHLGLMSAGDPLSTIPYVGVEAGMVIVSAGDPSCHTSPNEQDQRHLGPMLHLPVLDPSTAQEALDMTRFAFELSEACRLPVILRPTARVCHSRATVTFGPLQPSKIGGFQRNPSRYTPIPFNARRMRLEIEDRLKTATALLAEWGALRCEGQGRSVVLASGAPAAVCADLIAEAEGATQVAVWTLRAVYPLVEEALVQRLREVDRVLVVEELSAYLEDAVSAICSRHGLTIEILGKRSGHLPLAFEYTPRHVQQALHDALGVGSAPSEERPPAQVTPRPPVLCPSCGHRAAYLAARAAFDDDQLYFNDIGCYTLGYGPPLNTVDALLCMGAGFTLAAGVSRVTGKRTVGFLGDSTFFHSGMPALFNAVKERVNMVAVILDNQVTAMTGFQTSPGTQHPASIEAVVRALGVEQVETVDPFELPTAVAAFRRARDAEGLSVVIAKRPCPVHDRRQHPEQAVTLYRVDQARCGHCGQEDEGRRCGQSPNEAFARSLARAASSQTREVSCQGPGVAPCTLRCPLSLCIQGYATNIAAGHYENALEHILSRTSLPESVCRVCDRPCEDVCVRKKSGGAVAINDLKRFVVSKTQGRSQRPFPEPLPKNGMRVAVVGAGPAGLSASHSLALRGYSVTLFDARDRPGGLLAWAIPSYRLPQAALERDIARILEAGVRFEGNTALGRDVTLDGLFEQGFDAVYLAVGAARSRRLELEGAEAPGAPKVTYALAYLEEIHTRAGAETRSQISRAAIQTRRAEAPPPSRVGSGQAVVIGGGNAAIDVARTLLRQGADGVSLACVEAREDMPALPEEIQGAEEEGIAIHTGVRPLRLEAGAIVCVPITGAGPELRLNATEVVLAIGQEPVLEGLACRGAPLARTDDGLLSVDPQTGRTSAARVYAGGDLVAGLRTVTGAMGWGLRGAWGIDLDLRGQVVADRLTPPSLQSDAAEAERWAEAFSVPAEQRQEHAELEGERRRRTYAEVAQVLSEAEAQAEAGRCLGCGLCGNCSVCIDVTGCPAIKLEEGRVTIDAVLCTGCGVCTTVCPNQAIVPVLTGSGVL